MKIKKKCQMIMRILDLLHSDL